MFELAPDADLDGRLGNRFLVFTLLLIDYPEADKLEILLTLPHHSIDKKFEARLGGLELKSLVLEVLELFEHLHGHRVALEKLEAEFLGFSLYGGAPGEVRYEDPAFIADEARIYVFVCGRVFFDRADMYASLMGEGASSDKGLIAVGWNVCEFEDEPAYLPQFLELRRTKAGVSHFQAKVGDYGAKVCVSASFSDPVDRSLDLGRAHFDRRQGVCHGKVRVIMGVNSEGNIGKSLPDRFYAGLDSTRKRPSVGVAQDDAFSAGLHRLCDGCEGEFGIGVKSIEEMFRVVEHGFALLPQKADTVRDELKVALECSYAGLPLHVPSNFFRRS